MVKDLHKQYGQLEALGYASATPAYGTAAGAAPDPAPFVPHRTSLVSRRPLSEPRSKTTQLGKSEEELTLASFGPPGPLPPFEDFSDNGLYGAQLRRMPPPPMYLEGTPTKMPRFGEFPREVRIMIFRFAPADRMRLIENKTHRADTRYYSIWGGGRFLSDYIETKVYIRWMLARISALEYWRDRIRDYDKWDKTHFECTEEQKEAPIGGSRRVQEGMVKALDELAWMAKEVEIDDDDEGGVKV